MKKENGEKEREDRKERGWDSDVRKEKERGSEGGVQGKSVCVCV